MKSLNPTRRPAILFGIVMWILSIVMAGFLVQLGGSLIADVPLSSKPVVYEDFIDQAKSSEINTKIQEANALLSKKLREKGDLQAAQASAAREYASASVAFENWLKTRTATQAQSQNPEVIQRTQQLDRLNTLERDAGRKVAAISAEVRALGRQISDLKSSAAELRNAAKKPYQSAIRANELKIFLIRLLITLPLLLISAWMIVRKRQSAYWPLYRGFIFFSLFAFFVELVPYLPSYGGYMRSIVGVIAVVIAGKYLISGMRRYLENKKLEENKTESERRKTIAYETALKKMSKKTCPSCDRSFATDKDKDVDFCVHCGFCLYDNCGTCGARDNSFHKFCGSCGAPKAPPEADIPLSEPPAAVP